MSPPPNPDSDPTRNQSDPEEEEEGECEFCLYMKAGGCRDAFIDWEQCLEEGQKNKDDIVDKCAQVTVSLMKCMQAHSDYYEPILRADKNEGPTPKAQE